MFLCLASFILSAVLIPPISLRHMGLLFDIRMKTPGEPLSRTNLDVFRMHQYGSNFFQLGVLADSSENNITRIRSALIAEMLSQVNMNELDKLKQDSIRAVLNQHDADQAITKLMENQVDSSVQFQSSIQNMLEDGRQKIELEKQNLLRIKIERARMIGFPFLIALCFFLGMFIGILNRRQKYISFLMLGIFSTIFPLLYFMMSWFEHLARKQTVGPYMAQILFLVILSGVCFLLYRYAMKWKMKLELE